MSKPEKTQRSSGPMLGYEHIELRLDVEPDKLLLGQWRWGVMLIGDRGAQQYGRLLCLGLEGTEENAWHAAVLAREEIWELLR